MTVNKKALYKDFIYGRIEDLSDLSLLAKYGVKHHQDIPPAQWKDYPICRYCDGLILEEDLAFTTGYWKPIMDCCHKDCQKEGRATEAYECQTIDADCNDCRHFERQGKVSKDIFEGECTQFNKPVRAYPNFATGMECFEHRRLE